jgi:hypothetical protein
MSFFKIHFVDFTSRQCKKLRASYRVMNVWTTLRGRHKYLYLKGEIYARKIVVVEFFFYKVLHAQECYENLYFKYEILNTNC